MEGRWLPWKEQKQDIRPYPDYYKEMQKPLKPPPRGLEWRRLDDGTWELRTIKVVGDGADVVGGSGGSAEAPGVNDDGTPKAPEFLEHVVMPEDTLTGICMRYKVKARELRQLNEFVGDHFRLCHTLVVPNRLVATGKTTQKQTTDVVVQRFRNMSNLGLAEAKYYLQENEYDLNKAFAEWRMDKSWEASQKAQQPAKNKSKKKGKTSRRGNERNEVAADDIFPMVAGTINSEYRVTDAGSIEMREAEEHLADARVPLLSGRPTRFNLKAARR